MATTTSKIASLTSPQQQMETRFVALMTELFQLDEAEALDFGLYRVIRRHNREVHAFLGQIIVNKESRSLQGGRLAELLDASFEAVGHETQADDKFRLKDLEQQLGLKPGMTLEQRTALLTQADGTYFIPSGELDHDLALRHEENTQTESEFVAALMRDYLKPDAKGQHGTWASTKRRRQLMDYAGKGKWGFGEEKVSDIRDHPAPCEELWKRKQLEST